MWNENVKNVDPGGFFQQFPLVTFYFLLLFYTLFSPALCLF